MSKKEDNFTMLAVIGAAAEPTSDVQNKGRKSMTSRNLKRFATLGGIAALVLAGMLALGSGSTVRARAEDEGSHKRLEGTWRVQLTVRDCQTNAALRTFPALFTFDKGGTLTATTAGQSPALFTPNLGVWEHKGGSTFSAVSEAFVFSPVGVWIQTHRLTRVIELDRDADEFTDTVTLEIFDTNRNVIATGCGTSAGRRFE
jgi:hypothetical protein